MTECLINFSSNFSHFKQDDETFGNILSFGDYEQHDKRYRRRK